MVWRCKCSWLCNRRDNVIKVVDNKLSNELLEVLLTSCSFTKLLYSKFILLTRWRN